MIGLNASGKEAHAAADDSAKRARAGALQPARRLLKPVAEIPLAAAAAAGAYRNASALGFELALSAHRPQLPPEGLQDGSSAPQDVRVAPRWAQRGPGAARDGPNRTVFPRGPRTCKHD